MSRDAGRVAVPDGALHAARTLAVTPATRGTRPRWWPGVAAWALWALAMLGIPVVAWLDHLSRQAGRPDLAQLTLSAAVGPVLACVSAATVGAVLASRRPRHPVGWLLLALGLALAWGGVPPAYAAYGLLVRPGALPAAPTVARSWPIIIVTAQTALSFVLLLTPTGTLPSPRWRWWARVTGAATIILLVALAVASGPLDPRYQVVGGPFDLRGQGGVLLVVNQLALAFTTVAVVVGAASLVVRFRRARWGGAPAAALGGLGGRAGRAGGGGCPGRRGGGGHGGGHLDDQCLFRRPAAGHRGGHPALSAVRPGPDHQPDPGLRAADLAAGRRLRRGRPRAWPAAGPG